MWSTEEQNAKGRHIDGAQVFGLFVCDASAVDQGPFDDESTEGVADEDYGAFGAVPEL